MLRYVLFCYVMLHVCYVMLCYVREKSSWFIVANFCFARMPKMKKEIN